MRKFKLLNTGLGLSLLAGLAVSTPAFADDAPVLKIENFIGTIEVVTSNTGKIIVNDADGSNILRSGGNLTIDDDMSTRAYNCHYKKKRAYIGKGKWGWKSGGKSYHSIDEFPVVQISAPAGTHLIIDDSIIFGNVEQIGSGDIHVGSCGDLKLGDVHGNIKLNVSGSGDVKMGDAGSATLSISGSGDLIAGDFDSADISLSGSGDLEAGDVIHHAEIHASGAGDISLARIKGGLDYQGSGSSDFEADYVGGGDLTIRVSGSSDVTIKDGKVDTLFIKASGASDVTYGGSSVDAEARASGASDINIHNPSGHLKTSDSGAADVNIR